jgi:hypothetical protein
MNTLYYVGAKHLVHQWRSNNLITADTSNDASEHVQDQLGDQWEVYVTYRICDTPNKVDEEI